MEPKAPWKFGKGLLPELPPSTQVLDCNNETICPVRPRPCFQTLAIPIERLLYAAHKHPHALLSSPHLLAPQWQRSHPSQAQGHPGLEEGGRGIIVHAFSVCFAIFGSLGQPGCLLSPCPSPLPCLLILQTITLGSAPRLTLLCLSPPTFSPPGRPLPPAIFCFSPEFMRSSPLSQNLRRINGPYL